MSDTAHTVNGHDSIMDRGIGNMRLNTTREAHRETIDTQKTNKHIVKAIQFNPPVLKLPTLKGKEECTARTRTQTVELSDVSANVLPTDP